MGNNSTKFDQNNRDSFAEEGGVARNPTPSKEIRGGTTTIENPGIYLPNYAYEESNRVVSQNLFSAPSSYYIPPPPNDSQLNYQQPGPNTLHHDYGARTSYKSLVKLTTCESGNIYTPSAEPNIGINQKMTNNYTSLQDANDFNFTASPKNEVVKGDELRSTHEVALDTAHPTVGPTILPQPNTGNKLGNSNNFLEISVNRPLYNNQLYETQNLSSYNEFAFQNNARKASNPSIVPDETPDKNLLEFTDYLNNQIPSTSSDPCNPSYTQIFQSNNSLPRKSSKEKRNEYSIVDMDPTPAETTIDIPPFEPRLLSKPREKLEPRRFSSDDQRNDPAYLNAMLMQPTFIPYEEEEKEIITTCSSRSYFSARTSEVNRLKGSGISNSRSFTPQEDGTSSNSFNAKKGRKIRPSSLLQPPITRYPTTIDYPGGYPPNFYRNLKKINNGLTKCNSCSTLFVDFTLISADLQETLRCASISIVNNIKKNIAQGSCKTVDILSEKLWPLSSQFRFCDGVPLVEEAFKFVNCIFNCAALNVECAIIVLIYIDRMLSNTGINLMIENWARVVLGGLLIASKVWDDHAVWNVDYCQIFPEMNVQDLNELEKFFLRGLGYDVSVKASHYAKTYFELRDLSNKGHEKTRIDRPLTAWNVLKFAEKIPDVDAEEPMEENPLELTNMISEKNLLAQSSKNLAEAVNAATKSPRSTAIHGHILPSDANAALSEMKRSKSDYIYVSAKPPASLP